MSPNIRCDAIAGQLLVCHGRDLAAEHTIDDIRQEEAVRGVSYRGSMRDRLHDGEFPFDDANAPRFDDAPQLHLLHVPEGQEQATIQAVHRRYRYRLLEELDHHLDPENPTRAWQRQFFCAPNHILTLGAAAGGAGAAPLRVDLMPDHATYGTLVGFPGSTSGGSRNSKVLVLDTGIAPTATVTPTAIRSFVGPTHGTSAVDDHGHGTVVCSIIQDLVPGAELIVYKVADATGRASEWDTLCALGASTAADVINMSLVFGLADRPCPLCGFESGSSRSAVFEYFLDQLALRAKPPIVVAAAGNASANQLMYPARFGSVVAVGSVTHARELSSFSNWGAFDHAGGAHGRHFVLPGGGTSATATTEEYVAKRQSDGKTYNGTSFAAAYATAIVAALRCERDAGVWSNSVLLDHLQQTAIRDTWMQNDSARYGHGLMRLTSPPPPGVIAL